jgi:hypothetical protein
MPGPRHGAIGGEHSTTMSSINPKPVVGWIYDQTAPALLSSLFGPQENKVDPPRAIFFDEIQRKSLKSHDSVGKKAII